MKSTTKMDILTKAIFADASCSKVGVTLHGRARTSQEWFQQEVQEFVDAVDINSETSAEELADVLYTGLVHLNANSKLKYSLSHLIHILYSKVTKEDALLSEKETKDE
jgi:hypothetical protein